MQKIVNRVDTCRVCGNDDWSEITSFGATPLANGFLDPGDDYQDERVYPLELIACRQCWLVSLRHVIDPDALFRNYVYVTSDSQLITDHMRHVADLCADRAGLAAGDLVVEVGSNIGSQLEIFKAAGSRVVGVDPARNLAEIANRRDIATLPEFFGVDAAKRIVRTHGAAKVVLARQCFAHIDNVHDVLDGVTTLADEGTILVIEVPYLLELVSENQFDTIFHEHLSYFSCSTLERLFAMHGLRLIDVERVAVHGGSIVVTAAPEASALEQRPAVTQLLDLERRAGLTGEDRYLEFAKDAEKVIASVGGLVRQLARQGKKIAAYGAPSKGCALLQACGLGPAEVMFCTDTTSYKQGKVTPGTHIPVWPPEKASSIHPDYYLLLAWNYADEIIGKERSFIEQGGHFIVPIPEPKIVPPA